MLVYVIRVKNTICLESDRMKTYMMAAGYRAYKKGICFVGLFFLSEIRLCCSDIEILKATKNSIRCTNKDTNTFHLKLQSGQTSVNEALL